jgi:phytoene synthase
VKFKAVFSVTFPPLPSAPGTSDQPWDLAASYTYCRRLCQQARSSFPLTFWLLPPHQRRGMQALYAFLRLSDDLMDSKGQTPQGAPAAAVFASPSDGTLLGPAGGPPNSAAFPVATEALNCWRQALELALNGQPMHPVHPALVDTIRRFSIPPAWLYAVLDGVAQDAGPVRFASFAELYAYCWRVASAVGLACLAIWGLRRGVRWSEAEPAAVAAGIAFQLTNILRDLGEDLRRDRVYLPQEELAAFGCPVERWFDSACRPALAQLIRWQVERTRSYFRQSLPLLHLLPPRARTTFSLMTAFYQHLLKRVDQAGPEILHQRVRLSRWQRWSLFLQACLAPRNGPLFQERY